MNKTEQALDQLMRLAARPRGENLRIVSGKPALKTRFYADEAAAAAIAAGGAMAAEIWNLRSGALQDVTVDTRRAAASLVSFLHQTFEDAAQAPPMVGAADAARTAANGFVRAKDGRFVYLHPSFPESTKKLVALLGCEDTKEAVAKRVAERTAMEWENAIAEAGVCGAMCRSPEEWDASEQGRQLAAHPPVEVIKIGESDPEPFARGGEMPLSGVRVLDLTRVLAGPTCARTLAQYGADAMVISSPDLPSVPFFVSDTGHGKRAAFVDLKTERGRAQLGDLVRGADVFSQGYRQGALERMGFGVLDLARMRPGIIAVEINCYGHEGPWRGRPGWEQLAQTVTGMAHVHGGAESPSLQPGAVCDYTTGFLAAFGALIALERRAKYGGSYLVRASLCQTGTWVRSLGYADEARLADGEALRADELDAWKTRADTGFGPMRFLAPPVTLSATPARWSRGVAQLGTHEPAW